MERPRVPLIVTIAAALLLWSAFTFGLAGVGNLFFGRNFWAVAISPFELACALALVVGAIQLRRGNRAWWALAFVLTLLTQGQLIAESWLATPGHRIDAWTIGSAVVRLVLIWTLLLWPVTRAHLRTMAEFDAQEAEHSAAGHFVPAHDEGSSGDGVRGRLRG